jgi:endonuclease/exonuclease/phosphatase family metal-dependent hydrolase
MDIHVESKRIDYIFSSKKVKVLNRYILFNKQRVSDHYGVYIEIEV